MQRSMSEKAGGIRNVLFRTATSFICAERELNSLSTDDAPDNHNNHS